MDTLQGQHAVVTGGSRGIGAAIAAELSRLGANLTIMSRDQAKLDAKAGEIAKATGVEVAGVACDVASASSIEAAFRIARETLGPPTILVNNAGQASSGRVAEISREAWDRMLGVNLTGPFLCIQQVLPAMLEAKRGRIVVVSSASGQIGQAGQVNYSASKAGLIGAAKALAREVGKKSIYVNVVAPGFIETEMTKGIPKEQVLPLIPLNRVGTADDVASVVNFLCTDEHMYIHGQVIGINGGLAM